MWCVLGEATPNEPVLSDPNPDAAPVLGDRWSAPCPDEVAVPNEGAMGGDGSMAISQGTHFFVFIKWIVLSNRKCVESPKCLVYFMLCLLLTIHLEKSRPQSSMP